MSPAADTGRRLTFHALDVTRGVPAAGIHLSLHRLTGTVVDLVTTTSANDDGRTSRPLLDGDDMSPGTYEIVVDLGGYFRGSEAHVGEPARRSFYELVPIRFVVDPSDLHVHIALLASPWSYTTYRGS